MTISLGSPFWRLWTSSAVSNLADGALKVALPVAATRYTDSPTLVAGITLALTLPWLACALPAGALVDRLDRRRAMIAANVVRGGSLAVAAIAVATGAGSIWLLFAVSVCVGVTETVYDTAAMSIVPQLVPRAALPTANSRLYAVELSANQFAGPPLGGLLVATGAWLALGGPAVLWAVAIGLLLLVPGRFRVARPADAPATTLRADIAEGVRHLARHRLLRTLAVMVGLTNLATNASFAVFVLYAVGPRSAMGLSEPVFGVLLTATAVGSLVGALVAARVVRLLGRARSIALAIVAAVPIVGTLAVTADPWLVGVGFAIGGAAITLWNVVTVSLRQSVTPDRLLGRVTSAFRLVAWGTMPIGALVGGLLAEAFGLRVVFAASAGVLAMGLLGMLIVTDRAMDAAEADAEARERAEAAGVAATTDSAETTGTADR